MSFLDRVFRLWTGLVLFVALRRLGQTVSPRVGSYLCLVPCQLLLSQCVLSFRVHRSLSAMSALFLLWPLSCVCALPFRGWVCLLSLRMWVGRCPSSDGLLDRGIAGIQNDVANGRPP